MLIDQYHHHRLLIDQYHHHHLGFHKVVASAVSPSSASRQR